MGQKRRNSSKDYPPSKGAGDSLVEFDSKANVGDVPAAKESLVVSGFLFADTSDTEELRETLWPYYTYNPIGGKQQLDMAIKKLNPRNLSRATNPNYSNRSEKRLRIDLARPSLDSAHVDAYLWERPMPFSDETCTWRGIRKHTTPERLRDVTRGGVL